MTGPAGSPADPAEDAYRSMAGACYRGDAPAALEALGALAAAGALDEVPQVAGDGVLLAVAHGLPGADAAARPVMEALDARGHEGDEILLEALRAVLGEGPEPLLRSLPVHLDELAGALEGDPNLSGGRLDLRTGDVIDESPLFHGLDELDEELDDADDDERWLRFDSRGSRDGFDDMVAFLERIDDDTVRRRADRALARRGAFRGFKDELDEVPGLLARFHRFTDDRKRGRARAWLAAEGLRPTPPPDR
jgi:hypothetical protein